MDYIIIIIMYRLQYLTLLQIDWEVIKKLQQD